MIKTEVNWLNVVDETLNAIDQAGGLFLVTQKPEDRPNMMAIGWVQLGVLWGRPVCTVLVRPSRYTFELLEPTGVFTVSVPRPEAREAVMVSGTHSGKKVDKFAETGLSPIYHSVFPVPGIAQCPVDICCTVIQKTGVDPARFTPSVKEEYYPEGDFHTVYFGQIQYVWRLDQ